MEIQIKNKTFLKMFAIFFLSLLLITCLLLSYFFTREQDAARAKKQAEIESAIEHVVAYFDEVVQREYLLSTQLRTTRWVAQMASDTDVFADRYTPQKIQEIGEYFMFNTLLNTDVLFRAVYFTKDQSVVHVNGANSGEYFLGIHGVPGDQIDDFLDRIAGATGSRRMTYDTGSSDSCFWGNVFLLNPVQNSRHPTAYLFTMLNTSVLTEQVNRMLPASFTGFEIMDLENNIPVISAKERNYSAGNKVMTGYSLPSLNWEFSFYLDDSSGLLSANLFPWVLGLAAIMMALVFPAAFLLASFLYQQLSKLFQKLPVEVSSRDMYSDIENNISRLVRTLESSQRENCFRQLLAGTFQPGDSHCPLPDYQDQWVQTYLLDCTNENILKGPGSFMDGLLKEMDSLHCEFIPEYGGMMVLIASSPQEGEISALSCHLAETLPDGTRNIFIGPICQGYSGIALSFQEAMKKKQFPRFSGIPDYYLPIELEHQLILALRAGKTKETTDILNHLLDENDRQLKCGKMEESDLVQLDIVLVNDLVRVVLEKNLDRDLLVSLESLQYNSVYDMFGKISEAASEICALLSVRQRVVNTVAQEIVDYIDSHYTDSSLSIMVLQEKFHLSANTINKHIRDVAGTTFLPYLTYMRMEKAKELLSAGDVKISEVYRQVGYDVEFSFRRAFIRYSGYGPQNFVAPEDEKTDQE